ncbi:hypothetical protein NKDENANG_02305 [Candidatus Entotheonellaceae bacterium PAL068K]
MRTKVVTWNMADHEDQYGRVNITALRIASGVYMKSWGPSKWLQRT